MSEEAPSPFLEGTNIQYAWDSTSLGYLKQCPRKYYYTMIEGWRGKGEAVTLKWGQEYHHSLEYYYKLMAMREPHTPFTHDEALRIVVMDALLRTYPWPFEDRNWSRENLIRSIVWYLDEHEHDACKTVMLANGKPAVELSFQMQLDFGPSWRPRPNVAELEAMLNSEEDVAITVNPDGSISAEGVTGQPYILCGHLDRVVDFGGHPFVMDHKSTKSTVSADFFARFDPDNQMSLYTIGGQVIFDTPIRGVIIDAAQIAVGFTRFTRGFVYRTHGQLEEWLGDLRFWLAQAENMAMANYWPMNDKACFLCNFKSVCSKDPSVRQRFLEADFRREQWNPLKVR